MEKAIENIINLLTIQTQGIDGLEIDCSRESSKLASINQGELVSHHGCNWDNDLGECDTTPMEVEEGSLLPGKEKYVQDNEYFDH